MQTLLQCIQSTWCWLWGAIASKTHLAKFNGSKCLHQKPQRFESYIDRSHLRGNILVAAWGRHWLCIVIEKIESQRQDRWH